MKIEQTECSETWTYKLQTPGNYPEESIQHTEHGESLKSRIIITCYSKLININNNGTNWVEIFRANLNRVLRQDECLAKDATWSECVRLTHVTADSGCANFVTWSRWSYELSKRLSKIADSLWWLPLLRELLLHHFDLYDNVSDISKWEIEKPGHADLLSEH